MSEATMIERVARAIYDSNLPAKHAVEFEQLRPLSQKKYRRRARAAIEAMREPTEAMEHAGYDVLIKEFPEDWDLGPPEGITSEWYMARIVWPAMIDAILAEHPSKPEGR